MADGYLSRDREHLARMQRERRARMVRIDYMPRADALATIELKRATLRPGSAASTNSAILDAIVSEWARLTGINNQEIDESMTSMSAAGISRQLRAGAYDFGEVPELQNESRSRACAYESGEKNSSRAAMRQAENNAKQANRRVVCGARRHRDGLPCEAPSEPGKRRCRFHGGRSTGPTTSEGKERALANLKQAKRLAT